MRQGCINTHAKQNMNMIVCSPNRDWFAATLTAPVGQEHVQSGSPILIDLLHPALRGPDKVKVQLRV